MANTYVLISSQVLASSAASVTFSSIPATYTDLVLRCSARMDPAGAFANLYIRFNSDTATNYSDAYLSTGNGTTGNSGRDTSATLGYLGLTDANSATANTFGNFELYIPNYTASANKPYSSITSLENNTATQGYANAAIAGLWRNTAAITSITMTSDASQSFVQYSTFYLYGISNA